MQRGLPETARPLTPQAFVNFDFTYMRGIELRLLGMQQEDDVAAIECNDVVAIE